MPAVPKPNVPDLRPYSLGTGLVPQQRPISHKFLDASIVCPGGTCALGRASQAETVP
jgi:hypothetical protein